MLKRISAGHWPQITFTADFHELVRGDLVQHSCALRYDPHRIVPPGDIARTPGLRLAMRAYINFHPVGGHWEDSLLMAPGRRVEQMPDLMAQGMMFEEKFPLPKGCEELECWFSYVDVAGQSHWDSGGGTNYWLRFPTHDIKSITAQTVETNLGVDHLEVEVVTVPWVEAITLRWRSMGRNRYESPLIAPTMRGHDKVWTAQAPGIAVPCCTTIDFDLVYKIGGRQYTDDNEGTWYLAEQHHHPKRP